MTSYRPISGKEFDARLRLFKANWRRFVLFGFLVLVLTETVFLNVVMDLPGSLVIGGPGSFFYAIVFLACYFNEKKNLKISYEKFFSLNANFVEYAYFDEEKLTFGVKNLYELQVRREYVKISKSDEKYYLIHIFGVPYKFGKNVLEKKGGCEL